MLLLLFSLPFLMLLMLREGRSALAPVIAADLLLLRLRLCSSDDAAAAVRQRRQH